MQAIYDLSLTITALFISNMNAITHKKIHAGLLIAAIVIFTLFYFWNVRYGYLIGGGMEFDAEITAVDIVNFELTVTVLSTGDFTIDSLNIYGIMLTSETRRILSAKGKRLAVEDLQASQKIRATVSGDVIMEPYDRFMKCYQIRILE